MAVRLHHRCQLPQQAATPAQHRAIQLQQRKLQVPIQTWNLNLIHGYANFFCSFSGLFSTNARGFLLLLQLNEATEEVSVLCCALKGAMHSVHQT